MLPVPQASAEVWLEALGMVTCSSQQAGRHLALLTRTQSCPLPQPEGVSQSAPAPRSSSQN